MGNQIGLDKLRPRVIIVSDMEIKLNRASCR